MNLLADGHRVAVHDPDARRCGPLVAAGAAVAASPAEVAERSEITFTSLPTPVVMETVARGWLETAPRGAVLVDLTTNAPATVRRVGDRFAAAERHLLEAPLTGGAVGARARQLVFMVGGERTVYERCLPLLQTLGRATFYLGPLGAGNTAKLVNSLLAFAATWASLEGLAVAAKAGLDLRTMVEVVRTGGAGNFFTDRMVEGINERGRPTQFALELAAKDAGLLLDLAREAAVPTPLGPAVAPSRRGLRCGRCDRPRAAPSPYPPRERGPPGASSPETAGRPARRADGRCAPGRGVPVLHAAGSRRRRPRIHRGGSARHGRRRRPHPLHPAREHGGRQRLPRARQVHGQRRRRSRHAEHPLDGRRSLRRGLRRRHRAVRPARQPLADERVRQPGKPPLRIHLADERSARRRVVRLRFRHGGVPGLSQVCRLAGCLLRVDQRERAGRLCAGPRADDSRTPGRLSTLHGSQPRRVRLAGIDAGPPRPVAVAARRRPRIFPAASS